MINRLSTCLIKLDSIIHEFDENCPKDDLHRYAENETTMKINDAALNVLPGKLYTIEIDHKISKL